MTQDFKTKLLEYFTGNFQEGTTPYTYYQSAVETNINNLYQTLSSQIGNQYTGEFEITGALTAKTQSGDINIHILYGTAVGSTLHPHDFGFIVLIDDSFNVLDIITQYSSGVIMGDFNVLNVDENGYLYGIETNYNSTQKRFIMLNNVALKLDNENYKVKIRRTYNLPSGINSNYYKFINKEANGSRYFFAGITYVNSIATPIGVLLEIIVGASNNWTTYNYTGSYTLTGTSLLDLRVTWTGGNLDFLILGKDGNYACTFWMYQDGMYVNTMFISNDLFDLKGKFYADNSFIIGYITTDYSTYLDYTILGDRAGISSILSQERGSYFGTTTAATCDIQTDGINIYYLQAIQKNASDYNFKCGRIIIPSPYNYELIPTFQVTASSGARYYYNNLFITQENNLYTWYLQVENTCYKVIQSFNLNDYNNGAINNTKYFVPKSANLYNNSKIILSKNLYNLTVNDNVTTATVEISNMDLNNITINGENLIGNTYQNLVEANVTFTKNQYEVVDVNFINTIGIQNKNNETIQEIEGQNRLNNSISQATDYSSAKMTKYRINYADETTSINSCTWYLRTNYYNTLLSISVSKEISSIDFISQDENTVYTTIYPELEIGKTYKISQDVYIAPKILSEKLYYNTDEIYYNTDEVYH